MKLKHTYNDIEVGDRIEYETDEDPYTGENHYINGTVVEILTANKVLVKNEPGTDVTFEAWAEYCTVVYECA